MSGDLLPITQSEDECIESTTRHQVSTSKKASYRAPRNTIALEYAIRRSAKQQHNSILEGDIRGCVDQKQVGRKSYGFQRQLWVLIPILLLIFPSQNSAAINCRYPRSLEFLCKNSNNPKVTETNDHPLERLSRLLFSPITPLVANQERFPSAVETVNPLTVIKSTGGKDKDCSENDKYIENVKDKDKQNASSKRVSRSIKYATDLTNQGLYNFEDPCRKFVFAPACRGVTSKRSSGPGAAGAPKMEIPANPSILLRDETPAEDEISSEEESQDTDESQDTESNLFGKIKRSSQDELQIVPDFVKRPRFGKREGLGSFSSFYTPQKKKSMDNDLHSFSSFYSKRNYFDNKRANALNSFSSFYAPGKRSNDFIDSNPNHYIHSKRENMGDALGSFSSFYAPHDKKMDQSLGSFSSFYAPSKKRSVDGLDTFSSFYGPSKRSNPLGSFSSFYDPQDKRSADGLNSFSSFYAPDKRSGKWENKNSLGSFSSFYMPQKRQFDYGKRKQDILQPFSSFYTPSKRRVIITPFKRDADILGSFSSFYDPSKRDDAIIVEPIHSYSSIPSPMRRRAITPDALDSFSSFYGPSKRALNILKRKDVLRSFHSFYNPLK